MLQVVLGQGSAQDVTGFLFPLCCNNNYYYWLASSVAIYIAVPPEITFISPNQSVNETGTLTLNCSASVGSPRPWITWKNVSDGRNVTFPLIVSRQDEGFFRCTAENGIGSPATKDVFVTVNCKYLNSDRYYFLICHFSLHPRQSICEYTAYIYITSCIYCEYSNC